MNPNDGRVPRVRHTFIEEGEIKRPFLLPNSQILPSIIQQNSIVSPLAPTPPVSLNGITQVNHPSMSPIAVSAAATISAIPGEHAKNTSGTIQNIFIYFKICRNTIFRSCGKCKAYDGTYTQFASITITNNCTLHCFANSSFEKKYLPYHYD